jgi:hypothetical protein
MTLNTSQVIIIFWWNSTLWQQHQKSLANRRKKCFQFLSKKQTKVDIFEKKMWEVAYLYISLWRSLEQNKNFFIILSCLAFKQIWLIPFKMIANPSAWKNGKRMLITCATPRNVTNQGNPYKRPPRNINVNMFNPKSWTNEISHVVFWTIITLEWCTITYWRKLELKC